MREIVNQRNAFFLLFFVLAFLMAYAPIKALYNSSINSEYYSHIVLIPLVSIYFLYQERKFIFSEQKYSLGAGTPLLLMGTLLYLGGRFYGDHCFIGGSRNQWRFHSLFRGSGV
jgi:hypothetical protein